MRIHEPVTNRSGDVTTRPLRTAVKLLHAATRCQPLPNNEMNESPGRASMTVAMLAQPSSTTCVGADCGVDYSAGSWPMAGTSDNSRIVLIQQRMISSTWTAW